ncbi:MAG: DoxX family rane protein [Verrucomicrobiales bacterium]|nr:DoxX family rane protein [Verrucomicrobiales bacterium]
MFFIVAGANHFLNPGPYRAMMPSYLPWPVGLVAWSGVAEIVGGLGLLIPRVRPFAAWGLIALLVAVFPANLNVALHGWAGVGFPQWSLWLRLPLQFLFIWWVYRVCLGDRDDHTADPR